MDEKSDLKIETEVIFDKISRIDIYHILVFILGLYFFNSFALSASVFAVRIVSAETNLVPFISFTYGVMFFLFLVNFYRFYMSLNVKTYDERKDLLNTSLISLFVILVLNIIAELLISRIQF
jgi:hypothetical protein